MAEIQGIRQGEGRYTGLWGWLDKGWFVPLMLLIQVRREWLDGAQREGIVCEGAGMDGVDGK